MRSFFIPSLFFGRTGNSTGEPPALLRIFRDVLAMRLRLRLLLQLPADLESSQPKLVVANAPDIHLHDTAGMLHYILYLVIISAMNVLLQNVKERRKSF